jgi:predicted outer membrane repeat protein
MSFFSWFGVRRQAASRTKTNRPRKPARRLRVERLEDRAVLASYSAGNVAELIDSMNAANATPEADTIALVAAATYTLTARDNANWGPTGLPTVAAGGDLTIVGNGSTIERSTAAEKFRLFTVEEGASLTLHNVTLQGGVADYSDRSPWWAPANRTGGAVYSKGALTMSGVTIQNNLATVGGGGVHSAGALTLEDATIQNNQAAGWDGWNASCFRTCSNATDGGSVSGGGLLVTGGAAQLTSVVIIGNTAQGGNGGHGIRMPKNCRNCDGGGGGGNGGDAYGGGILIVGGEVTLRDTVVTGNTAQGGEAGRYGDRNGRSVGGGIYVGADALLWLDAFTGDNVTRNRARRDVNISGSFTILS